MNQIARKIRSVVNARKNKMFASVLATLEEELRKNGAWEAFKESGGFHKVRNMLLDNGNELTRIISTYLEFFQGYDSIKLGSKILKEMEHNNGERPNHSRDQKSDKPAEISDEASSGDSGRGSSQLQTARTNS